uniref:Hypothetical secreted protein n=1 Tax=Simulium nigrimanum TaxID=683695 RepID=D1FQ32_SIMNI
MSKVMLLQPTCLWLVFLAAQILGTGYAKHYIDEPLATDCITKEVLWGINYHHDVSVSHRRLLEYDSMTCNNYKPQYEKNYNELLKKGYKDMINSCVKKNKVEEIRKNIIDCVDKKIKIQTDRLNEIKMLITECKPPKTKVDLAELKAKDGKVLNQPINRRSSSARRRSYF